MPVPPPAPEMLSICGKSVPSNAEKVVCMGEIELAQLAKLTVVKELVIKGGPAKMAKVPLDLVAKLATLESLTLQSGTKDISPLSQLKLKKIDIAETRVADISPLRDMTSLERLDVPMWTKDISAVAGLTALRRFTKFSGSGIDDLSVFRRLTKLQMLSVSNLNEVTKGLDALKGLTELVYLDISYAPISDLSYIARATKLEHLDIYGTNVTSLEPLANMSQLKELRFGSTKVRGVEVLGKLASLEVITFPRTPVRSLKGLERSRSLRIIDLSFTKTLQDIRALESVQSLEKVLLGKEVGAPKYQLEALKKARPNAVIGASHTWRTGPPP